LKDGKSIEGRRSIHDVTPIGYEPVVDG
jgi:hypothetical protein